MHTQSLMPLKQNGPEIPPSEHISSLVPRAPPAAGAQGSHGWGVPKSRRLEEARTLACELWGSSGNWVGREQGAVRSSAHT